MLVVAVLLPGPRGAAAQEPEADPVALVMAYTAARNAHDLDAVVAYFADGAVVRLPYDSSEPSGYVGQESVRLWARNLLKQGYRVEVANPQVTGSTVRWDYREFLEPETTLGAPPLEGTMEASFQVGKITHLNVTVTPDSVRRRAAAIATVRARSAQASAGSAGGEVQRPADTQARRTPSLT